MAFWHRAWESSRDRSTFALGFSSSLVTDVFVDLSRTFASTSHNFVFQKLEKHDKSITFMKCAIKKETHMKFTTTDYQFWKRKMVLMSQLNCHSLHHRDGFGFRPGFPGAFCWPCDRAWCKILQPTVPKRPSGQAKSAINKPIKKHQVMACTTPNKT